MAGSPLHRGGKSPLVKVTPRSPTVKLSMSQARSKYVPKFNLLEDESNNATTSNSNTDTVPSVSVQPEPFEIGLTPKEIEKTPTEDRIKQAKDAITSSVSPTFLERVHVSPSSSLSAEPTSVSTSHTSEASNRQLTFVEADSSDMVADDHSTVTGVGRLGQVSFSTEVIPIPVEAQEQVTSSSVQSTSLRQFSFSDPQTIVQTQLTTDISAEAQTPSVPKVQDSPERTKDNMLDFSLKLEIPDMDDFDKSPSPRQSSRIVKHSELKTDDDTLPDLKRVPIKTSPKSSPTQVWLKWYNMLLNSCKIVKFYAILTQEMSL